MDLNNLQYILQHNCLIGINKAVVTGVSGGPDSLFLLDVLWRLGYRVIVAHLNHGLRPKAEEEAMKVESEASKRNLAFAYSKVNVRQYSRVNRLSVEEAARVVRYQFLFHEARKANAQAVAVGHTADDQVETVLMHFLRGSGLAGLSGMQYCCLPNSWDQEISLIRPLLGLWRGDILKYLEERAIQPEIDESNEDRRYFRNRLRHDLIPILEKYNPQVKRSLFNMAEVLRGDEAIVEMEVSRAWNDGLVERGPGYLGYNLEWLRNQSLGMQRQLLRKGMLTLVPGLRDIDFKSIDRGVNCIQNYLPGKTELVGGLHLEIEAGRLWLIHQDATPPVEDWPQIGEGLVFSLALPGQCDLGNGWIIETRLVDAADEVIAQAKVNLDLYQVWMDAEQILHLMHVRRRRTGDRMKPLGMGGHTVKLSDLMVNHKIPSRVRDGWPVIVCGEEIIWVPGLRLAETVRITSTTRQVAHMKLMR